MVVKGVSLRNKKIPRSTTLQTNKTNARGTASRASNRPAPGRSTATILSSGMVIRNLPIFGYSRRMKLQYYATSGLSTGAGAAGAYVFSANGMFDPDISGTGGQPMGFDQAMTFFNHYTVHSCKVRAIVSNASTSVPCNVALVVSGSSTVTTVVETLVENGDLNFQSLGYAGSMGSSCTLERTLDLGKFQSVPDVLDDPNMRGDAASNPAEQAYFHIAAWNIISGAALQTYFQVLLEYDVTFHEPRKGSLS